MKLKTKILPLLIAGTAFLTLVQVSIVLASNATSFSQTISDGSQSVDIVDSNGDTVGSPSVTFGGLTFSFSSQTATGTLGASAQRIRAYNPTSDDTWTVSMAATSGATAVYTTGSITYDFNDSNSDGTDDSDTDSKGGKLTVDPSVGTLAAVSPCSSTTNVSKGSSGAFREIATAVSSITLLTGASGSSTYCRWDFTGISLSQAMPAAQPSGTYTLSFTITIA